MDEMLRGLLFHRFRIGKCSFDFLEGLLAVCMTGTGFLLRTSFEAGLPDWVYLLVEWYLAVGCGVLVFRWTDSGRKALITYGMIWILPTVIAEGSIFRGNACVGALLFVCALMFYDRGQKWLFTVVTAALLLWSVKYFGILFACGVLWQKKELKSEQLLALGGAGILRFATLCRAWHAAGYSMVTFFWPNIYEIVGPGAVVGQNIDPIAMVGLFLTPVLLVLSACLFCTGRFPSGRAVLLRLFLFFGLTAVYFLPYMDQSCGYLFCILSVLYVMLEPGQFLIPMLLQIVSYAGYQERFNEVSMMPMTLFAVILFLVISFLGLLLVQEAGIVKIWKQRN